MDDIDRTGKLSDLIALIRERIPNCHRVMIARNFFGKQIIFQIEFMIQGEILLSKGQKSLDWLENQANQEALVRQLIDNVAKWQDIGPPIKIEEGDNYYEAYYTPTQERRTRELFAKI